MHTQPDDTSTPRGTDLEALARETGVSVEVLRTLASISDPANEHLFSAEAARKAFARPTAVASEGESIASAVAGMSTGELGELLASSAELADQLRDVSDFLATPGAQAALANEAAFDPFPAKGPDLDAELQSLAQCDAASDAELVARVNAAPDMGGAFLAEAMAAGNPAYEGDPPFDDVLHTHVHLLFRDDQAVQWSFDRRELDQALHSVLADGGSFAHNQVLELVVPADLVGQLALLRCPETEPPFRYGAEALASLERYRKKERAYVDSGPELLASESLRVFIVFLANGACRWSPSGNNIDSIARSAPEGTFLSGALRLDLKADAWADLSARFKWACDNF